MKTPLLLFCLFFCFSLSAEICTWEGTVDSNWNNASNWSCGMIPTVDDDVIIEDDIVTLDMSTTINSLSLMEDAHVVGGGEININNDLSIAEDGNQNIEVDINCSGVTTIGSTELTIKNSTLNMSGG